MFKILRSTFTAAILLLSSIVYGQDFYRCFDFAGEFVGVKSRVSIAEAVRYSQNGKGTGYGFDLGTDSSVHFLEIGRKRFLHAIKPFYFSVDAPEGNYKVTIHFQGLPSKSFRSWVRSESRRLHIENLEIHAEDQVAKSFVVNIKDRRISDTTAVLLKPREKSKLDWDDKLTLEFQGENMIRCIEIQSLDEVTTVFLAGNSTVVNQEYEPWASWGQMIPRFFNDAVSIANHAESGLTLSSFLASRRLEKVLSVAKPGDYLFIEFGHNDQKEKGNGDGAYNSYSERLRLFVNEFRNNGGIPVIVTSTARRQFDEKGDLGYTLGDYPTAARAVAKELDVPLIDLNAMTRQLYTTMGVEGSKNAFVHYPANTFANQPEPLQDNTHFNTYGAYQIAKMVTAGIIRTNLPLKKFIVDFMPYDPGKPDRVEDWNWPPSVSQEAEKPDGN